MGSTRIHFVATILSFHAVSSSFVVPGGNVHLCERYPTAFPSDTKIPTTTCCNRISATQEGQQQASSKNFASWSPQDLTKDIDGFLPIPQDDYVKKYQRNPDHLWPVEFFVIPYRRTRHKTTGQRETQILVRKSANGTSKWGLGTGVPSTRWILSTHEKPPLGYEWSTPTTTSFSSSSDDDTNNRQESSSSSPPDRISFQANNYPEFPKNHGESWTYHKIDIREDAFRSPDAGFHDPELEEYAIKIRNALKTKLSSLDDDHEKENDDDDDDDSNSNTSWDSSRIALIRNVIDKANSVAAIQGTLRMSGLFAFREIHEENDDDNNRDDNDSSSSSSSRRRHVSLLDQHALDPAQIAQSMRIYTMFPQMPDPMPLPSTSSKELQIEIASREARMAESGRNPHHDPYGRRYTHKSTSNVSNTIHGVYFTMDMTNVLPGGGLLEEEEEYPPPALDLFGTQPIPREWKSLEDLEILDNCHGECRISEKDPKSTFISGFIARQLVKEGVIDIHGED